MKAKHLLLVAQVILMLSCHKETTHPGPSPVTPPAPVNNARRNVRTGDGLNYETDYTYTYDAKGRPLVKTGDLKLTNGASRGQHVELLTTFSYYD